MSLIQSTGLLDDGDATNTTGTKTFSVWSGANFTAGSAVLVQFSAYGDSAGAVTGVSISGTAATIVSSIQHTTLANYYNYIAFVQSVAGGNKNVVITYGSAAASATEAVATEYSSGHFAASAFDKQASGTVASGSLVITTAAKAQNDELVAVCCGSSAVFTGGDTITGMAGFTQNAVQNTSGKIGLLAGLKTVSAAGTEAVTFTTASTGSGLAGCIATFKLATGGASRRKLIAALMG